MKEANSQATHANSEDGCQDSEKQGTQTHAGTECAGNVEGQKADEEKSIEAENESHGSKVVDDNTLASEEGEEDEEDDEEDDEEASGDSTEDSGEDGSMWEGEESASEVDDEGEDDEEEEGETTEEEDVSSEGSSLDQGVPLSTEALRHEIPFENLDKIFSSFGDSIQRSKVRLLLFKLGHCFNAAVCEDMLESIEDADMRRHFHEAVCEDMQHIQHQSLNILQCRELYRTCFLSLAESGKKLVPVFVFVNPDSGGHLASRWLELPPKTYMHGLPLNGSVEAWTPSMRKVSEADISEVNAQIMIYSLMEGDAGKKRGFQHLAKVASESSSHVRVIVCGGDGSVSWVITEMTKHKIDFDHVALGVCAYGTGNDFSRVLGWGPASSMQYPAEDIDKVRALATDWIQAQLTPMDVWSACVSTKPGGNFALAKPNGSFGLTEKDKERLDIRSIKGENKGVKTCHKVFVNYFSLGALSQVGSSFEQRRTKSRLKNMYTYAKLGLSKAASSKDTLEIDRLTAHLREENEYILSEAADHPPSGRIVSLIFSNIPSMMGGSDLWARSSSTVGKGGARFLDWVQDLGDQCIELMTFSSFKDVVYEKMGPVFHGNAKRLHGGRGPFHLQFKDDSNPDYERTLRKTGGLLHFQADGEYMAVYSPDSVKVQWYRKISVMRALRGQHIDFLSEVLDDGARLLHFIQFLDRRGNTHAAESAYVAAMVRSSAASKGVVEVLHHIVEELLSNESLIDYLEDLSCRRKTSQDDTHRAEDEPNFVVRHEILGAHVDKEHEMFTFGTCITHGVRLAVETQSLILEVLGCDSGDPLSSVLRDTRLTSIECVQRWCGPDVDAEHLQVHSARSFDVPRLGHIWVEACEVPFFFDDAAPETFQRLRAMAGIREQDYINSVCRESSGMITFGTNSRSGESFFFSHDGLYMIKTISDSQASKLLEMLPSYEAHLKVQTRSLLVRFVGLYRVRTARAGPAIACAGRWFVVMASIFYTSLGIHEKYDLKGSTSSNRRSKAGDIERGLPLKDLDWKDRLSRDGPLQLSAADAERLLAQHECDTAFLESFDLFDYSVLLGIHDISKASGGQSGVGATRKTGGHLPFSAGLAAAKFLKKRANRKAVSEDAQSLVNSSASAPISTVLGKQQDESGECDSGSNEDADSVEDFFEEVENLSPITRGTRLGEAIVSEDGGQLYFIGIIDILEPFDKHRAAEEYMLRGLAQVSGWAAGHSLVNPAKYRKRQMEFFRKTCPATGKQKEGKMSRIRSSVRSGFGLRRSSTSIRLPI